MGAILCVQVVIWQIDTVENVDVGAGVTMPAHSFLIDATNAAVVTVRSFQVLFDTVFTNLSNFAVFVLLAVQIRGLQRVASSTDNSFSSSQFTYVQWAAPGCSAAVDELYAQLIAAQAAGVA